MDTYEFRNPVVRDHFNPSEKPLSPRKSVFWTVVFAVGCGGFFGYVMWGLIYG